MPLSSPPSALPLQLGPLPPLSLYVHVPWCLKKCPYCDFNSHRAPEQLPEQAYIQALLADLDADLALAQGRPLHSIFIGGGTPSLLSAEAFDQLLNGVAKRLAFEPQIEITLEANPGTFELAKFADYRALGINRLSLGVQSFQDTQLQALGRVHSAREARDALEQLRQLGFERFNLDLMHGLPGQTPALALQDLRAALEFSPPHLSWYQLTLEPNTEFFSRPPRLPEEEQLWAIQEQGLALLEEHGYRHYEISAHAQPGQAARHNLNYWRFGDYLGIGAGAHDKLTDREGGRILRRWKQRQPKAYLDPQTPFIGGERVIDSEELPLEFLMNALRLSEGVASHLFSERTGLPLTVIEPQRQVAVQRGLLVEDPERIAPTEQGRLFLNDLLDLFV